MQETQQRERLTSKDFDPELWAIFDDYVHGHIDRRAFLDRAAKFAVGGMTAVALLDLLNPKFAEAQVVPKDDKRLKTEWVEIDSPKGNGKIKAYVCRPANATGKLPGILVVHENRGLNPHIEDIARRLALDNFMAVAPDALTPRAKTHNYLNLIAANQEAQSIDPEAWAVLLDVNGNLAEGMGSNIFVVMDGEILTPREKFVLPGVSRRREQRGRE